MWKIKSPVIFPKETRYRPILESLVPPDPMSRFHLIRGSAEEEFPDLKGNRTCMGRVLTYNLYQRQFTRCTEGGVIFDDVIRLGLEEPASQCVGCVAGDAQCYVMFCDFFDRVIERYHDYKINNNSIHSDFNYDNLKGGDDLDSSYITGSEVSVVRGVEPFTFPSHCSRGERRELVTLAKRALQQLSDDVPGKLYSIEELTQQGVPVSSPSSTQMRTGVARDWPDARAVWVSKDGSTDLVIWVNIEDHLKLVSSRKDGNLAQAFKTLCVVLQKVEVQYCLLRHPFSWKQQLGYVSSSPADVGTGLRASVTLRLQHLPQHCHLQDILTRLRLRMEPAESPGAYHVTNAATIGSSEVQLTQLVVDGVKLLVAMETRLEGGASITDLVPAHKVASQSGLS